ncbi:MAG: TonB-dependent receptor [Candidatus Krumholzibacteriota bacterium]
MKRLLLISIFILLTTFSTVFAQNTTGNIEGRIIGPGGESLAGARIDVSGPQLQGSLSVSNQNNGYFLIPELRVGTYTLVVSHDLYAESTLPGVVVWLGVTTNTGPIEMTMQAYEMETMIVTAQAPLIDPASATGGGNITFDEFSELPVGRDYKDMAVLLPHANTSYLGDDNNISGSTGLENKYFIDGVDVTDPNQGNGGTELPYNFIREVRVRTGGYEAEYRSSLGGILEVVTNTGSNELHGQVFGFFTNSGLTQAPETNVLVDASGDFTAYDFGFGVGGPVVRDKLWYYAALNPTTRTEDIAIPDHGIHENSDVTYRFAGKLNWRANESNDFVLSVFGDPGGGDTVWLWPGLGTVTGATNPDPFLHDSTHGGVNSILEGRHWLGDNAMLRTSISYLTNTTRRLPRTETGWNEPLTIDNETNIWSGGTGGQIDKKGEVFTGGVHGTWLRERHTWKVGLEYRVIWGYIDERLDILHRYAADDWYLSEAVAKSEGSNTVPSVYLQDSWRVTDPLRLNLGVRWDGQILRNTGRTIYEILDQWQPRIGFTYQLGQTGTQQIFGSAGRFYQEMSLNLLVAGFSTGTLWRGTIYDHDPRQDPSGGTVDYESFGGFVPEGIDLEGQHHDEFTLGYERQLGTGSLVRARGIYRTLRRGIEDTFSEEYGDYVVGNMGFGPFDNWEPMKRDYQALELTYFLEKPRYSARASYVLSRTHGNFTGLFYSEVGQTFPNLTAAFDDINGMPNFTGLLPNDRPHVVKLSGSYQWDMGLTVGTFFTWMSGTPLSEYGQTPWHYPLHLVERGSAGRTPSIWSLNLRLAYRLRGQSVSGFQPRVIVDLMNIGSPRKVVNIDQQREFAGGGLNLTYGEPTAFQPPMSVRLGLEVGF